MIVKVLDKVLDKVMVLILKVVPVVAKDLERVVLEEVHVKEVQEEDHPEEDQPRELVAGGAVLRNLHHHHAFGLPALERKP